MQQTALSRAIAGAGGGSEKPRTPVEAPDSLRSIAYARILDMVGEGEIYGLADQENPLSCVFFNETPVANDDGSHNFKNFSIESRTGTQDQAPIKGFDGVESELAIGVELRKDVPWVRQISNLNVTSARVRMSVPTLTKSNPENGDVNGAYVSYRIEVATDGGSFQTVLNGAFRGKTTTKYERSHRIDLPVATVSGWTIRVTRFTDDSDSVGLQNATYIESFAEIIDAKLRMPMTALVACIVDAEQFSNIPARAYLMCGRIIRVPSNYDPDTRVYTGIWDGTFVPRYSNNPAWCFYDMVTNSRYGLGHLVPESLVNKWELYKIGMYCDQMVPDGKGGYEPRFATNLFLQSQGEALRVMQDMATMFRGIMYASGGTIVPVADMPAPAVYTYNPTNVVQGRFTYGGSSRKVRHTVALVSWNDPDDFSRAKVEYVEDAEGIARYGYQPTQVIATGCASQSQAHRFGRYLLATALYETDGVEFSVGLDGTLVPPGKIVTICDPLRAGRRTGGRVVAASDTTITVDILPVVSVGDTLTCIMPDGVSQVRDVVEATGRNITVSPAFDDAPVAQSVWAVESTELSAQRVRILAVRERSDGKGYDITAIQHVEGKFDYADTGVPIDERPIGAAPPPAVPSPINITVTQRDVTDQYTSNIAVDVNWEPVGIATGYTLQWRQNDGEWSAIMRTSSTTVEIPALRQGTLDVQVTAFDAKGRESLPSFGGPFTIGAVSTPPGVIVDIITNQEVLEQIGLDNQAAIAQEIIDRQLTDANLAITNAELAAAEAQLAVVQGQVGDILNADVHNSANTYPAGDLVQSGSPAKLYRAKQNVPAGIAITNTTYWEVIGNYASLGEAVGAVAAQASANTAAVTNLDGELTALTSTVDQQATEIAGKASASAVNLLTTRVSTAEGKITTNTNNITSLTSTVAGKADASALTALTTRVSTAEGKITTNTNSITSLTATVAGKADTSALNALSSRVTVTENEIDAQATDITNLEASIGQASDNLVLTQKFDDGTIGSWQAGTITTFGAGVNAIRVTEADGYVYENGGGQWIACQPGEVFDMSAVLWTMQFRCNFYDKDKNYISPGNTVLNGSNATTFTGSTVAPAGASWMRVAIRYPVEVYPGESLSYGTDFVARRRSAAETANASATSALTTRVTTAEGNITSNASALTALTATVAGKASTTALNALDARVVATEAGTTANASAITQVTASLDASQPVVTNGSFETNEDWVLDPSGSYYNGSATNLVNSGTRSLRIDTAAGIRTFYNAHRVPAKKSQPFRARMAIRNYGAGVGVTIRCGLRCFRLDGSYIGTQVAVNYVTPNASALFTDVEAAGVTHAETAFVEASVYVFGMSTGSIFIDDVEIVLDGPVNPTSAAITQIAQATADSALGKANATIGVTLDVNGYVTGYKATNDGSTGIFSIVADKFQIVSPGGGSRTEYSNGNWRVYDASGVLRVAMGVNI